MLIHERGRRVSLGICIRLFRARCTHLAFTTSFMAIHFACVGVSTWRGSDCLAFDGAFRAFIGFLPPTVTVRLEGPPTGEERLNDARHGGSAPPPSKTTHCIRYVFLMWEKTWMTSPAGAIFTTRSVFEPSEFEDALLV